MAHENGIVWEQTRFKVAFFRGKIKIVWGTVEFFSPKEGFQKINNPQFGKEPREQEGVPCRNGVKRRVLKKLICFEKS